MNRKELTLSDLIARKSQKEKLSYKLVYVPGLEGELKLKKLPLIKFMGLLDGIDEESSSVDNMIKQIDLIYEHVPMFHNKQLQDEFECVEPTDVVLKVLDDDISSITVLVEEICALYGVNMEDLNSDLKNS